MSFLWNSNNFFKWHAVVIQSLSRVQLVVTPWTAACQASLPFTVSQSLLIKFMSTEPVMLSSHITLCCPLLLLPSVFPSIRVFSKAALPVRWPKYWSFTDIMYMEASQITKVIPWFLQVLPLYYCCYYYYYYYLIQAPVSGRYLSRYELTFLVWGLSSVPGVYDLFFIKDSLVLTIEGNRGGRLWKMLPPCPECAAWFWLKAHGTLLQGLSLAIRVPG